LSDVTQDHASDEEEQNDSEKASLRNLRGDVFEPTDIKVLVRTEKGDNV